MSELHDKISFCFFEQYTTKVYFSEQIFNGLLVVIIDKMRHYQGVVAVALL